MLNIYAQKPTLTFANLLAAITIASMGWMAAAHAASSPSDIGHDVWGASAWR